MHPDLDSPLTPRTLRAELRRHRWAQWRGLWGIIALLVVIGWIVNTLASA